MIPTSIRPPGPDGNIAHQLFQNAENGNGKLRLESGDRVGVIGSGPAGSFFSHFMLDMTQRLSAFMSTSIFMIRATLRLSDRPAATCAVGPSPSHRFSSGVVL